jgi:hypothetical protein
MDEPIPSNWSDIVHSLTGRASGLLVSLLSIKKQLELETNPSNDCLYKGGFTEIKYAFKKTLLTHDSPSQPPLQKISSILQHPDSNYAKIIKKFPEPTTLGPHFQSQGTCKEVVLELDVYYTLFSEVSLFINEARSFIGGAKHAIRLNVNVIPYK